MEESNGAQKRRVYFRGVYDEYEKNLNSKDWARDFSGNSVTRNWDLYRSTETKLTNTHVPLVMPKDYNEPWMNRRVMKQWKRKHRAWRQVVANNSNRSWRRYKEETT